MFILLHRINPARNEARFYLLATGPTLLDEHAVIRSWGRIGGHQRWLISPCASHAEADRLASRLLKQKLKHGYKIIRKE